MANISYYQALRVSPTATPTEIQEAYQKLSVLFPENSKDETTQEIAKIIANALSVLSNPPKRAYYDIQRITEHPVDTSDLTQAEHIINSWQISFYTDKEQAYLAKIRKINLGVKFAVVIIVMLFLWAFINLRFDIIGIMVFTGVFFGTIGWIIYRIQNPPPPLEI